ncbi:IS1182 family transposase [Marinoscillum sp.]|uniref:IS1182 family transposase n=1 Tax=Marinoscillum sp. TaxID=2024838 RepID=UPI003BA8EFB0
MSSSNLVFKDYNPSQIILLPPSLEELIDDNHPVRVVNAVIDRINVEPLLKQYKPGGTSVYHPKMLLKVLVYGYLTNVYSSRKMESALKENIHMMWLAAMNRPDHNTIARFRSERLKDTLRQVFGQIVVLLVEEGLVSIKNIYTDGTKIEANANKYTFVWGRAIKTSKERIARQLDELWDYTQKLAEDELSSEEKPDFKEIDQEKVSQAIEKIDQALKAKPVSKRVRQKLSYAKKNWPSKLKEYAEKEAIMGENRNSYSKTDPGATFMRMKEDHMLNGQLKPGYNFQISTSDQFIVNYSIHQNPTDTLTLKPHLQHYQNLYQTNPESICADAGYGSEENYDYLEEQTIDNYVKYNYFHKEQSKKWKENPFKSDNLHYNKEQDKLYCPMGQPMDRIADRKTKSWAGYEQTYARYQAKNCDGCPLRGSCHKSKGNRIVEVNNNLNRHKQKVKQNLQSEQGLKHRSKRPWDVEAVFGAIKHNRGFRRFMLKGMDKVEIEAGLLAIAHNLAKTAA